MLVAQIQSKVTQIDLSWVCKYPKNIFPLRHFQHTHHKQRLEYKQTASFPRNKSKLEKRKSIWKKSNTATQGMEKCVSMILITSILLTKVLFLFACFCVKLIQLYVCINHANIFAYTKWLSPSEKWSNQIPSDTSK